MCYLVNKELDGWSVSKCSSQQFSVWVEISEEWCPSGVHTGTSMIFFKDMGSGIECSLNKFAGDTKLCGTVNTLEGRDIIQKDLDRLERWTCVNLMKFNNTKCKVLHLAQSNPKYGYRLGKDHTEKRLADKDLRTLVDEKLI
ncbi:rna-directed dna polymerase from mobile element jockey-like [Willisornis vidua]|uniref:Rna-directed dna polymerase from mobile element jockey-like n=1 Tax=Willisornis vidua TaxID=1566151 RepID=A0ABQ9CTT6_9PASS|nr:rna-directed dna polymerase from mobile element jockey-like [Willisornis vidua]